MVLWVRNAGIPATKSVSLDGWRGVGLVRCVGKPGADTWMFFFGRVMADPL